MSKASPILICPTAPLLQLPPHEQDVLRRFFTQHVRGMDDKHDKRWRRFIRDLFRAAPGEGFQIYRAEERGGPFHRRHRVILANLFDRQERFPHVDVMHDWLKLKCWFVNWEGGKPVPRSTSFAECSEDEIREFNARLSELLHQPWMQKALWPHLTPAQRHEMAESALAKPGEQQ